MLLMLITSCRPSFACLRLSVIVPSPSIRPAIYAASTEDSDSTSRYFANDRRRPSGRLRPEGQLVEAAGQLFHLFRDGLDYAFIRR